MTTKNCACCHAEFDTADDARYCLRCSGYGQGPGRPTGKPHYAHSKKWHADFSRGKYYEPNKHPRQAVKHQTEKAQTQFKRQSGKCYYCGTKVGTSYHVDHVVPTSRGGSSDPDNLVIACAKCNVAKNDRLPHEWPEGGRLL